MAWSSKRGLANYSAKSDADDIEQMSEALGTNLRTQVHQLNKYPVLSEEWRSTAKVLAHIAKITTMEAKLPKEKAAQTLWEGNEQALRFIIEDAKLNMCLHSLVEYKRYEQLHRGTIDPADAATLVSYEVCLGCILRSAWSHVEALQTTDLGVLIEHITFVFRDGTDSSERLTSMTNLETRQEVLCMYYLHGLLSHVEDVMEERVMPLLRSSSTIVVLARFLAANHTLLTPTSLVTGAAALAMACGTEDFGTYRERHVPESDREVFIGLKNSFLAAMCEDDYDVRKKVRPLLDFCMFCSRCASK